ncbi:hypothetical protein E3N88_12977 [Mikania micrantha]|uniref:Phytocyanin domain-containing protein n=1 Tax=Mikania micrantha TaxID=192012 RepID=A0A5N6P8B1_9ASTR|nr:hypothetical protein E3N88_12977 [Mikania micrantha]
MEGCNLKTLKQELHKTTNRLKADDHRGTEEDESDDSGCNMTNVLQPSSNGNTTFALTKPGDRYFVCGNRLHCYAGMKLQVVVDGKTADGPIAGGPEAEPGGDSSATPTTTTNTSSSKNNNPSSFVPSSVVAVTIGFKSFVFVGFMSSSSYYFTKMRGYKSNH